MCHVELSSCFRLLRLPRLYWGAFCIYGERGGGGSSLFVVCLLAKKYNRVLCQRVLERLASEAGLAGVVHFVYLDDVLVLRRALVLVGAFGAIPSPSGRGSEW